APPQLLQASLREHDVASRRLLRLLLKRVKHEDRILNGCDIDHTKGTRSRANADFANTNPNGGHRLPVVRIQSPLDSIDLKADLPPRSIREGADFIETVSEEGDRFHGAYIKTKIMRP